MNQIEILTFRALQVKSRLIEIYIRYMIGYLWIIQLTTSSMMTGIIWIIQRVHYPGFIYVKEGRTQEFHAMHTSGISPVVAPLMIIELLSSAGLVYFGLQYGWLILSINLLIWLSTFLLQVPIHNKLGTVWNLDLINRLVSTN